MRALAKNIRAMHAINTHFSLASNFLFSFSIRSVSFRWAHEHKLRLSICLSSIVFMRCFSSFFFLIGISIAEQVKIRRLVEMQFMRHATNTFYALLIDFSSANIHSIEAVRLQRKFHSRKKKHLNCLHAI